MPLKLMYITNSPDVAVIAQEHGVDRIFVDLETIGKAERQADRDAVQSNHCISDIEKIKPCLSFSKMLVRVNPINAQSKSEIDAVIKAGADIVMLPMWKTVSEIKLFLDYVSSRAKTCLLLETREADGCLDDVLALPGIDEIYIGLNDLHISYELRFMFEPLANGTVERICKTIKSYGIPYGFGGIARIGKGLLPAEKVIMEHYRLGSSMAILSRSFCNTDKIGNLNEVDCIFRDGIASIRDYESTLADCNDDDYEVNKIFVRDTVASITRSVLERKEASA